MALFRAFELTCTIKADDFVVPTIKHNYSSLDEVKRYNCQSSSVYGPCVINRKDDIVDVILKIMEDGPKPMRNFRPTKKERNVAERFNNDHQEQYEARGRPSRDKITRVHRHNTAYPKLRDELDRKLSIMNTHAILAKCKKRVSGPKHRSNAMPRKVQNNTKYRKKDNRSRITKPKTRAQQKRSASPYTMYRLSRSWMHKGNQNSRALRLDNKRNATTSVSFYVLCAQTDSEMTQYRNNEFDSYESSVEIPENATSDNSKQQIKKENSTAVNSVEPETREPSFSSYDSLLSLDHEPMVK